MDTTLFRGFSMCCAFPTRQTAGWWVTGHNRGPSGHGACSPEEEATGNAPTGPVDIMKVPAWRKPCPAPRLSSDGDEGHLVAGLLQQQANRFCSSHTHSPALSTSHKSQQAPPGQWLPSASPRTWPRLTSPASNLSASFFTACAHLLSEFNK